MNELVSTIHLFDKHFFKLLSCGRQNTLYPDNKIEFLNYERNLNELHIP